MGSGYGAFRFDDKQITAHYYLLGDPPPGTRWTHTCGIRHCVNPDHFELGTTGRKAVAVEDRFWSKVQKTPTCWLWTGAIQPNGYGYFALDASRATTRMCIYAHTYLVGKAPDGLVWDHLCRVRHCVRPDHLKAVTQAENIRRGERHISVTNSDEHRARVRAWAKKHYSDPEKRAKRNAYLREYRRRKYQEQKARKSVSL